MAYETLIAAFEDGEAATAAIRELRRMGIPSHEIKRHPVSAATVEDVARAPVEAGASGFWGWLFGADAVEERIGLYRKALSEGGTVLTVRVLEEEADSVRDVLDRFGPIDLAEDASGF